MEHLNGLALILVWMLAWVIFKVLNDNEDRSV